MQNFIGKSCTIQYNSDLSGQMIITSGSNSVVVNEEDILNLVAEYVKRHKITQLQHSTPNEILLGNELTVGMG